MKIFEVLKEKTEEVPVEAGDDIEIMDRVRVKTDLISEEVFTLLWRQLQESIWVNNHDKGGWDEKGQPWDVMSAIEYEINEGYSEDGPERRLAKIVYIIMDWSHMHSMPVVRELLDYAKEVQLPEEDDSIDVE